MPLRSPVASLCAALGAAAAVVALLFPPLLVVREPANLRDLVASMAAAMLGVTQVNGMDAVTEFHCTVERAPRAGEASGPCLAEGTLHLFRSDLEAQPA